MTENKPKYRMCGASEAHQRLCEQNPECRIRRSEIFTKTEQLGWTPRKLNEIIKAKRNITANTAINLANILGTTPEFRLNLQQTWDLNQAYRLKKAS
jgi:addiction module HigA family antidote